MVKTVVSCTIAKGSIPFIDNYVRNDIPFKKGLFRWPYRLMVKTQRLQCCYTGSKPVKAMYCYLLFCTIRIIKIILIL